MDSRALAGTFSNMARLTPRGGPPQPSLSGKKPPKENTEEIVALRKQRDAVLEKIGVKLPKWWPRNLLGDYVTHVYRLEDEKNAAGLKFCTPIQAISHNVTAPGVVDFTNEGAKNIALAHVFCGSGMHQWRPFLSVTIDLSALGPFLAKKKQNKSATRTSYCSVSISWQCSVTMSSRKRIFATCPPRRTSLQVFPRQVCTNGAR